MYGQQAFFGSVYDVLPFQKIPRAIPHLKIPNWHSYIITSRMCSVSYVSACLLLGFPMTALFLALSFCEGFVASSEPAERTSRKQRTC